MKRRRRRQTEPPGTRSLVGTLARRKTIHSGVGTPVRQIYGASVNAQSTYVALAVRLPALKYFNTVLTLQSVSATVHTKIEMLRAVTIDRENIRNAQLSK